MRPFAKSILLFASLSAVPVVVGCTASFEDDVTYSALALPTSSSVPNGEGRGNSLPAPPSPVDQALADLSAGPATNPTDLGSPPAIETSGLRFAEIPAVRRTLDSAGPWEQAEAQIQKQIDAPDIKQNLHDGLITLAPRVARALIDHKGDIAIVTVAVYEDVRGPQPLPPATGPATSPATPLPGTQPTFRHVAIAIAFEGFGRALEGSFVPRVLANQPRPQQGQNEPADPNLVLDRKATSYLIYKMGNDGLSAAVLSQDELRPALADAVAALPTPATRPSVDSVAGAQPAPETPARDIYGVPPLTGSTVIRVYDNGEPAYWRYDPYYDGYLTRRYDDPYLDDLYGCRWGAGYFVGGGYFGHRGWYDGFHGRRGDHDRDHDRKPDQAKVIPTRDLVPWQRSPIVSPTNPTNTAAKPLSANTQLRRQWDSPRQVNPGSGSSTLSSPAFSRSRSIDFGNNGGGSLSPLDSNAARSVSDSVKASSSDGRRTFIAPNGNQVTVLPKDSPNAKDDDNDSPKVFSGPKLQLGPRAGLIDSPRPTSPASGNLPRNTADSVRASRGFSDRLNATARGPSGGDSGPRPSATGSRADNSGSSAGGRGSDGGRSDSGRSDGGSRSDSSSSRGDGGGSRGGGRR